MDDERAERLRRASRDVDPRDRMGAFAEDHDNRRFRPDGARDYMAEWRAHHWIARLAFGLFAVGIAVQVAYVLLALLLTIILG